MPQASLPPGLKRILVVCPNWLGDVLFATPFLRVVRSAYPGSDLDVLLPERVKDVLLGNPHIRRTIVYRERSHVSALWETPLLINQLRHERYDAAILLTPSKSRSLLLKSAGIAIRAGFASTKKADLTHEIPAPDRPLHKIDHFLALASGLGMKGAGREMDFFADPQVRVSLDSKLREAGRKDAEPYAVIHIGGNWHLKRWPIENFASWVRSWLETKHGVVVICGTSSEGQLAKELMDRIREPRLLSLCGQTTLHELGWLLKGATIVLSNDSGPVHLAAAQKTPLVALFGPTSADLTGPVTSARSFIFQSHVGCAIPCYFRSCNDHICMRSILPQDVLEKSLAVSS